MPFLPCRKRLPRRAASCRRAAWRLALWLGLGAACGAAAPAAQPPVVQPPVVQPPVVQSPVVQSQAAQSPVAQSPVAQSPAEPAQTRRILVLPALQWDTTGVGWDYAAQQGPADLARVMGGLHFGMLPEQVGEQLPSAGTALHWPDLPQAKEFSEDVRYVWLPLGVASTLRAPVTACFGESSYVVLLFLNDALFRVSWRLLPGTHCADPHAAAEQLYAGFVPLLPTLAVSSLYHTGYADVLDVTDPTAGPLIATRWRMRGQ
jgi:hypothetical protein